MFGVRFLVGKVAKIARLILVESQFYVSFIFADGFLVGKVAKVAYITGGEGCDHCLKFILVHVWSVAKARLILVESQFYVSFIFADGFLEGKVAKVAYITGVEGCDDCLKFIFVYVL